VRTAPAILVDYHAAVAAQARDLLDDLSPGHLAMAIDERWNPPVTLGVRPVRVVDDDVQHAGPAPRTRAASEPGETRRP